MIKVSVRGNYRRTKDYLKKMKEKKFYKILEKHAKEGVEALSAATPVDTGKTAASWYYEIEVLDDKKKRVNVVWKNSNVNKGVSIALILQYGHGNGHGAYIRGRDYINPAIRPIFDKMADVIWKEVSRKK